MPDLVNVDRLNAKNLTLNMAIFITSALSLVAALAWNTAMKTYFASREDLKSKGPWVYAAVVTAFAFTGAVVVARFSPK